MPYRKQSFTIFQFIRNIQHIFAFTGKFSGFQFYFSCLLRGYLQILHPPAADHLALLPHTPVHIISRQIAEEIFVIDIDFPVFQVGRSRPDVLVKIAHFIRLRIRPAVGIHQSFVAIVPVDTIVQMIKITSVTINDIPLLAFPTHRVIHKLPDKASLVIRILTHQIHILLKASERVPHSMGKFTLDQRFGSRRIFAISYTILVCIIHRAYNIRFSFIIVLCG